MQTNRHTHTETNADKRFTFATVVGVSKEYILLQ